MSGLERNRKKCCEVLNSSSGVPGWFLVTVLLVFAQGLVAGRLWAGTEHFAGMVQLNASVGDTQRVGSGFVVAIEGDSAYVVTAGHVVEGRSDQLVIEARFFTDIMRARQQVKVVDQDYLNDLALLRIWPVPRDTRAMALAELVPASGTAVELIGFPQGTRVPVPTYGQVSMAQGSRLRVDARADEGNSGGPLMGQGYVLGVVVEVGHLVEVVPAPIVSLLIDGTIARSARGAEIQRASSARPAQGFSAGSRGAVGCRIVFQSGALRTINVTPSSKSSHAASVQEGSSVEVLLRQPSEGRTWFRIRTQEGSEGWLPADQVEGCR